MYVYIKCSSNSADIIEPKPFEEVEEIPPPPPYPNPYKVLNPNFISFIKSVCYLHSFYHKKHINLEDVLKVFV
jgi:hypothetical protein